MAQYVGKLAGNPTIPVYALSFVPQWGDTQPALISDTAQTSWRSDKSAGRTTVTGSFRTCNS